MDKSLYERYFSVQRMNKYFEFHQDDIDMAIAHYHLNIELSKSFYPCLSLFEIAFRNSIHRELTVLFNSENWYLMLKSVPELQNLGTDINRAKRRISKRNEILSSHKLIAELTLGFWVRLFNAEYELILWKSLRKVFPNLRKSERQRKKISAPINKIRTFRNRIFHHEPISWNMYKLEEVYGSILNILFWMEPQLSEIVEKHNNVRQVIDRGKKMIVY